MLSPGCRSAIVARLSAMRVVSAVVRTVTCDPPIESMTNVPPSFDLTVPTAPPVGPSGFDPEGKGHHGREAISKFYDMTIATADKLEFLIDDSLVCGNENVNIGKIRTTIGGSIIDAEGVFVYRVNDAGKIASLRAFWEVDRAMKTARKA